MANLRILLLGTPAVYLDEKPVPIQRRIQRALLFYLAEQGDMVSRADLLILFWPEEEEELARRHLREALSKLRSDLPQTGLLITGQDKVGLDFNQVYVDALEFQRLMGQAGPTPWKLPVSKPLPEAIYQLLLKAVRLWRTPHFLAGINLPSINELENWLVTTSQNLEHQRDRALERLADHSAATGDLEAALNWLRRALESDETNEDLHLRVLNTLVTLGRRSEAIKYYNYVQDLIRREVGSDPSPALQSLFQRIHSEMSIPVPTDRPGWPVSLSMQVPFVGREQALKDLKLAYHRSGMVVVFGEAGAGKSRLIQELFISTEPAPRLLLAPSRPLENNLPFQPIIDLLRHSVTLDDWLQLSPVWASQLAVLLPELVIMRPEVPPIRDLAPEPARAMLFEAIRQLFEQIATGQRILLFLDDAQWADEATLATLAYLVERSFFNEKGLLVIAARPEEMNPSLDHLLASSHNSPVFLQVNLEQLSEKEISDLTRYALGQTPSAEFVRRLAQDTGGNPLFLLETLRAILEISPGPDLSQPPEALPLASSIHLLVRNRLRSLGQVTRQVLVMAAVIGNEFFPLVLEKASRMDTEQVVTALDDLERAHLIRPTHPSTPAEQGYYFIHDKIREVLLLELSPARKRLYHQRAALALQEVLGSQAVQQASVLARHLEMGGDFLAAYQYWLTAGQRARQLFSLKEAYAAYRRAEMILQNQGQSMAERPIHQLYTSWGELAYEVKDHETIGRVYNTLLHLGEQRHSRLLVGSALSGMGTLALLENRSSEGLNYLERALVHLKQSEDSFEHMQAYIRTGRLLLRLHRLQEAVNAFEKALELAGDTQELNFMAARSEVHYQISFARATMGWPEKGSVHAELALQQCAWSAHPNSEVRAYTVLGLTYFQSGRYLLAREYCQKGIDLAEQIQNWTAAGQLHIYAGHIELAEANLDGCLEHVEKALSFGQRLGLTQIIADSHSLLGDLYRILEQYSLAAGEYQQAVTGSMDSIDGLDGLTKLGYVLGIAGQLEMGHGFLEQARATAEEFGLEMVALAAQYNQLLLQTGPQTPEKTLELLSKIEAESLERGMGSMPVVVMRTRARIALQCGQTAEALELADLALERGQEMQNLWGELQGLLLKIQIFRIIGESKETLRHYQEQFHLTLDKISIHVTRSEIRGYFQAFSQKLTRQLG